MLFAHISDFHVFADRPETRLVRADAEQAARKVVADLAGFAPKFDAVLFTGDLTDGGSAADYALLTDILAPLDMPVFMVPGNHDRREAMRTAFSARLPLPEHGYLNYQADLPGMRLLALDTLVEGKGHGALAPQSLDWLRQRLAEPATSPTAIILHHPPFSCGNAALDRALLIEGEQELAALVAAFPAPLAIFAGHVHRPYRSRWHGAFCAVAGSPAFQMGLDLSGRAEEPPVVDEPYAYFIYRLDGEGGFTCHTRYVDIAGEGRTREG